MVGGGEGFRLVDFLARGLGLEDEEPAPPRNLGGSGRAGFVLTTLTLLLLLG